jgi:outer membrane lipoprotein-sorting protein
MDHLRFSLTGFVASLVLSTCTLTTLAQTPNATAIIKNMSGRYSTVTSYQDIGVVETTTEGQLPKRSTSILFKTYFTRPGKIRFEWIDSAFFTAADRSVFWTDGTDVFSFRGYKPEIEKEEDLGMAMAGATGVSLGSARTVPSLLLNRDVIGFSLTDLSGISLKGEEVFEGEQCYVLAGFKADEEWKLWISKKDFLLRKLRRPSIDGEYKEEIHRDIRVEEKISESIYRPKVSDSRIVNELDKEKEADIRHLLQLLAPSDKQNAEVASVFDLLRATMPNVPEKIWTEVITELGLNGNTFVQIYVPIYDWHYSATDIKELIKFYESPFGQKFRRNFELIEMEAAGRGASLGKELIERIREKLRTKGYKSAAA